MSEQRCPVCGGSVVDLFGALAEGYACRDCTLAGPLCARCGVQLPADAEEAECATCRARRREAEILGGEHDDRA